MSVQDPDTDENETNIMSRYIDGFVIPIKKADLEAYRIVAEQCAAIWREHGALGYIEAAGEDMEAKGTTSFPQLANCAEDETVIFSWVVFASRETRDAANAKIHADPRMKEICGSATMAFDFKRMAYGGFKTIVEA